MVALHEDPASEVPASRGAVDPTDGVLDVLALVGEVEELVNAVELDSLVVDHARDDGFESKCCPGDETGESESSNSGGVEGGVFGWRAEQTRAIGADQFELGDVAAERSGEVVVLAMDVVGNCST